MNPFMTTARYRAICSAFLLMAPLWIPALTLAAAPRDLPGEYARSAAPAQKLLLQADDLFKARNYESAREVYRKALTEAETTADTSDMTEALAMIARTCLILGDTDTGYTCLHRAERLADDSRPLGWSRYLGVKGRFLWQDNRPDEATDLFKDMYDYCVKHQLHERAIDAAHMVAITGTHDEQITWAKKGIAEAEAGLITGWLGPLWNNLGATYEEMGRFDSSLQAYMKAREYHRQYGSDRNRIIADYAVGHALVNLEKYDEARLWLEPVLTAFERMQDGEFIGLTCRDLGEIGYASGDYREAHDLLVRARDLLEAAGMDQWDPDGYRKILDRIDDAKSAIE